MHKLLEHSFLGTPAGRLFISSFLALFAELLFIRWLPLRFVLLAYYSNLILLAALLGIGIGMIIAQSKESRLFGLTPYFITGLVVLTLIASYLSPSILPLGSENDFVWNGLSRAPNTLGAIPYVVLLALFSLSVGVFVTLGHEIGIWFKKIESLRAYTINIAGSIAGVVVFSALSAFSLPPVFWFLPLAPIFFSSRTYGTGIGRFLPKRPRERGILLITVVLASVIASTAILSTHIQWSPYYEIQRNDIIVRGEKIGFTIFVNQAGHQQALDLSGRRRDPFLESKKHLYELPYGFLGKQRPEILILGSGTGNDVAAALHSNPARVDAVEIDPQIARLGADHPEQPYRDARVHLFIEDARVFLERSQKKYDLISFGFLDSHRLFSAMSSIRLENYLYTRESMRKAAEHLKPGGTLAITYAVHERWIAERIFNLLLDVFKTPPLVYQGNENAWGTVFIAQSSEALTAPQPPISPSDFEKSLETVTTGHTWGYSKLSGFLNYEIFSSGSDVPTDDWPHLFLKNRGVPGNYVGILFLVMLLSFLFIRSTLSRSAFRDASQWNFFFMGAAFSLIETKGVTELAIVLGSTWVTNVVVITSILFMIMLSTILVLRVGRIPIVPVLLLLIATLLINFYLPLSQFLKLSYVSRVALAATQVALPILFSGMLFATYFKKATKPDTALGFNLVGAVFGGLFEYSSLVWGQKVLFLFAIAFYIFSFFLFLRASRRAEKTPESAAPL